MPVRRPLACASALRPYGKLQANTLPILAESREGGNRPARVSRIPAGCRTGGTAKVVRVEGVLRRGVLVRVAAVLLLLRLLLLLLRLLLLFPLLLPLLLPPLLLLLLLSTLSPPRATASLNSPTSPPASVARA